MAKKSVGQPEVKLASEVQAVLYDSVLAKGQGRFRLTVFALADGRATVLVQRGKAVDADTPQFAVGQFSYVTALAKYSDEPAFLSPGQARFGFEQVRARIVKKGYRSFADLEKRPAEEPEPEVPVGVKGVRRSSVLPDAISRALSGQVGVSVELPAGNLRAAWAKSKKPSK